MLRAVFPLRASLFRLARVRNCSSKSRIDSGSGRPLAELAADQQPLRMAVKFAFAAFMTYEVYDLFLKSDTLFINGYVRLASSKDAYNVATGVSRMSRLRDSDAALAEGRSLTLLRRSGAASDHTLHPAYPEGHYLTAVLAVVH